MVSLASGRSSSLPIHEMPAPPRAPLEMRKCSGAVDSSLPWIEDSIDVASVHESQDSVKILSKKVVPRWSELALSQLHVDKISGGITNILFSVFPVHPTSDPPVIVRIFGPMTEKVIDREHEMRVLESLSKLGIGPRVIARFNNGVVQSFIPARTLTTTDMCSERMIPLIARSLAQFHGAHVPGAREPMLWCTLQNYLDLAEDLSFEDASGREAHGSIDFHRLRREVRETQDLTSRMCPPVVFSHNDLLAGNILIEDDTARIHLIDFEYSEYGYRGYDIANHFNEFAGFECDYFRYPGEELQTLFFRHYLKPSAPNEVGEEELGKLAREVSAFRLASHLFWGVWAIIQARYSPIDFDYMQYFQLRYSEYQRLKNDMGIPRT